MTTISLTAIKKVRVNIKCINAIERKKLCKNELQSAMSYVQCLCASVAMVE